MLKNQDHWLAFARPLVSNMDYYVEDELGIAPLLAAAAPMAMDIAGNLLGGIMGGGKKAAAPAAAAASPGVDIGAIRDVVSTLLSTLPPNIKADMRSVLQEAQASSVNREELARNIQSAVQPQLAAAIQALQTASIQREATSEHNRLVKEDERWEGNKRVSTVILTKILELSNKLDHYNQTTNRQRAALGMPNL